MEEHFNYVKRNQRDYRMSLKLQIVGEIEWVGELSTTSAQRKYGIQAHFTLMLLLSKNCNFKSQNPVSFFQDGTDYCLNFSSNNLICICKDFISEILLSVNCFTNCNCICNPSTC